MDYSKMSDFEINKRVFSVVMSGRDWNRQGNGSFDYCNNPTDAWPIIVDNKITVHAPMRYDEPQEWLAFDVHDSDADFKDSNPLRAAMLVFLKMQESANVPANPTGPDLR